MSDRIYHMKCGCKVAGKAALYRGKNGVYKCEKHQDQGVDHICGFCIDCGGPLTLSPTQGSKVRCDGCQAVATREAHRVSTAKHWAKKTGAVARKITRTARVNAAAAAWDCAHRGECSKSKALVLPCLNCEDYAPMAIVDLIAYERRCYV